MNLVIKQNNQNKETVLDSSIVEKLYNLTKEDVANGIVAIATVPSGGLQGWIEVNAAYEDAVDYLNTNFGPNLKIDALSYYIRFEDPNIVDWLVSKNIMQAGQDLTTDQAASKSMWNQTFKDSPVVSFNEFKYFTKVNTEKSQGVFRDASLESIDLTNLEAIAWIEFWNAKYLKYFHGEGSEEGVLNLTKLRYIYDTDNASWFHACEGIKKLLSLGTCTVLGSGAFDGCKNLTTIHQSVLGRLTQIRRNGFRNCPIVDIIQNDETVNHAISLPNLTSLEEGAFARDTANIPSFTEITSLGSITSIGASAFKNCTNLATINIPSAVTSVGAGAFDGTAWYASLQDGPVIINNCILYKIKGTISGTYNIPSNITSISGNCFQNQTTLTGVTSWPSNITAIPNNCFYGSGLTSFDLTGIVSTGSNAFKGTKLTSIVIPNSVTTLGADCFSQCSDLTSVTIGTGVTSLGRNIFSMCPSLETLVIPSNVKSLERDTLERCTSLQWVRLESTTMVSLFSASCFDRTNNCIIYVPSDLVDTYKADSKWSSLASRIQAIPT